VEGLELGRSFLLIEGRAVGVQSGVGTERVLINFFS
jgi:hypothetical protein